MELCFTISGREFWIRIPVLIERKPGPDPDPWITGDLIKEKFARDLQILATVDQLASGLSSGLRKQVQDMTRKSAAGGLPEGMKLDFGKGKQ